MSQRHRISINCTSEIINRLNADLPRGVRQNVLHGVLEAVFEGMDKHGRDEIIGQALRGKLVIGFKE